MGGVVGAGGGDDRDVDRLDDRPEQLDALGIGEHGTLARGARHHQAVAPVPGQMTGQGDRAVEVELPVGSNGVTMAVITEPNRATVLSSLPVGR